jgi:transcriptional regulator with XRE-family HTH domain
MALRNREIGERIAALRKAKGNPPQEIVAQRIGVANRSYQSWEAGDTKPSWRNLEKLAKFYGVTEEWVLLGDVAQTDSNQAVTQLDRIEAALTALEEQVRLMRAETAARDAEIAAHGEEVLRRLGA